MVGLQRLIKLDWWKISGILNIIVAILTLLGGISPFFSPYAEMAGFAIILIPISIILFILSFGLLNRNNIALLLISIPNVFSLQSNFYLVFYRLKNEGILKGLLDLNLYLNFFLAVISVSVFMIWIQLFIHKKPKVKVK